jgi:hypothetical protein
VGALDDPEATSAIIALCVVGSSFGDDVADVCSEAVRRGCIECTHK